MTTQKPSSINQLRSSNLFQAGVLPFLSMLLMMGIAIVVTTGLGELGALVFGGTGAVIYVGVVIIGLTLGVTALFVYQVGKPMLTATFVLIAILFIEAFFPPATVALGITGFALPMVILLGSVGMVIGAIVGYGARRL